MGLWNSYFLVKLYLYFRGFIRLDFILNLLFIVFLILRVPKQLKFYRSLMVIKYFLSVVSALLLLWHESWLPPLWDALTFLNQQGMPSKEYVYRFLLGFFNPWEITALVSILFFCILVRNRITLTPVVLVLLLIVPLQGFRQHKGEMEKYLAAFYQSESARVIRFDKVKMDTDFDIIILHICSLSWDDLREGGLAEDVFLKQFDYVFTDFNSVTSYSNPSAIRLLRSTCGQRSHDAIYNNAPRECYLFETLRTREYETYFTFNHDGLYSNFAEEIKTLGHLDAPLKPADIPIQAYNFDGSPIFDDYAVLEKWWGIRQGSGSKRAAVYYNTISLHEGAHWAGEKEWWKRDRVAQYNEFTKKLFKDVTKFFDLVASSGRNAIIIFVPEHGLSLRGNTLQAPGLRDIPLPQITTVPVGIKLIGKGHNRAAIDQQSISKPTSYLSLSYLIAFFLDRDPFGPVGLSSSDLIAHVPETDFVAENQGIRIVKKGVDYFLYGKEKKWITLPSNAVM